jgi:hypothetical protein
MAGCGAGQRQDSGEPSGNFTVSVPTATFPSAQRLAQNSHLVIAVRNDSSKTIPNVAVTICNTTCAYPAPVGQGTSVQAFSYYLHQPYLANHSRPIWIVDRPPGECIYSCLKGGPGGAVTAYSNTWAQGSLPPGDTATFDWALTAVKSGNFIVAWEVAAGLNGKAKAVLADGSLPHGLFAVNISSAPQKAYVTGSGQVIKSP